MKLTDAEREQAIAGWEAIDVEHEIFCVPELANGAVLIEVKRPNGTVVVSFEVPESRISAVRVFGKLR